MAATRPICTDCGYPAGGLESSTCPECGEQPSQTRPAAVEFFTRPRRLLLDRLWRPETGHWERALLNVSIAAVLAATAMVWLWLIDPIRGALGKPVQAAAILFHLVFVIAAGLTVLGGLLIAVERGALLIAGRVMHVTRAGLLASRITSVSTGGLVVGAAAVLAIVAFVQATGLSGAVADALPLGGVLTGLLSWLRAAAAGLWTAGMLRDAGW
ncbi:MAG: hypothetical protein AAGF47_00275 [Planctomycetota bacterium]